MYDVEGSVAGIDQLLTNELPIVHEMGATLFSERFRTRVRRLTAVDVLQSTTIDVEITNLPEGVTRILGVVVFADNPARLENCAVMVHDPVDGRDFPIWVWEEAQGDAEVRIEDDGAKTVQQLLTPQIGLQLPSFVLSDINAPPPPFSVIALRSDTTAFGAGDVTLTAFVHIGFTFVGGLSSYGARVPSW